MTRLRRRLEDIMVREIREEVLLLDMAANRVHQLNQTAGFIWRRCEDMTSPQEIATQLVEQFDVSQRVALADVIQTLENLRGLNLVLAED